MSRCLVSSALACNMMTKRTPHVCARSKGIFLIYLFLCYGVILSVQQPPPPRGSLFKCGRDLYLVLFLLHATWLYRNCYGVFMAALREKIDKIEQRLLVNSWGNSSVLILMPMRVVYDKNIFLIFWFYSLFIYFFRYCNPRNYISSFPCFQYSVKRKLN